MPSFTWEGPTMCSELCCLGENKDAQRYPHSHLGSIHSKKTLILGGTFHFHFPTLMALIITTPPPGCFQTKQGIEPMSCIPCRRSYSTA